MPRSIAFNYNPKSKRVSSLDRGKLFFDENPIDKLLMIAEMMIQLRKLCDEIGQEMVNTPDEDMEAP